MNALTARKLIADCFGKVAADVWSALKIIDHVVETQATVIEALNRDLGAKDEIIRLQAERIEELKNAA